MTPDELAANAEALQEAFGKLGITPEMALMEEGRGIAGDRYNNALQRATELGQSGRVAAIQARIERDATTHTRREMLRLARGATAGERPTAMPVPANLPSASDLYQGIQRLAQPAPSVPVNALLGEPQRNATQQFIADTPGSSLGIDWGAPGISPSARQPELPIWAQGARGMARALSGLEMAESGGQNFSEALATRDPVRAAAAVGQGALAAAPFLGPVTRAAFSTVPRAIGAGLGAGLTVETANGRGPLAGLMGTAEAADRGQPSDAVKQLQLKLRDAGYYSGPIDGRLDQGGPTWKAKAAYDAAQQAAGQQEIERQRAAAETARIQAEAAAAAARGQEATAKSQETERQRLEDERRATQRAAGNQRLQDLGDRWSTQALNTASAVGPYVGYALGGYLGHRLQNALIGRGTAAAEAAAERGNALMAEPVGNANIPGRVGRVNAFWAEGNPARAEPFTYDAGRRPYPYTPNPNAPAAGDLYRRTWADTAAEWLPVPAVGGLEAGIAEFGFRRPYSAEVAAATDAVAQDPSEANIQRLQIARLKATVADTAGRIGQGVVGGALGTQLLHSRGGPSAVPTAVPEAEMERGRITNLLMPPPPPPPPPPTPRGGGRGPRGGGGSSGGGQGPIPDSRLGGSGHRDPVTGRIAPRPE